MCIFFNRLTPPPSPNFTEVLLSQRRKNLHGEGNLIFLKKFSPEYTPLISLYFTLLCYKYALSGLYQRNNYYHFVIHLYYYKIQVLCMYQSIYGSNRLQNYLIKSNALCYKVALCFLGCLGLLRFLIGVFIE